MSSRGTALAHTPVEPIHPIMTEQNSIGNGKSIFTASLFLFALYGGKRPKFRGDHAQAKVREGVVLRMGLADGCTRSVRRVPSRFLGEKTMGCAVFLGRTIMKRRA